MAFNTIGINLYLGGEYATTTPLVATGSLGKFPNLQEIGEIGFAKASGSNGYDQIEVTTLADDKHVYIDGLIADSDSDANEMSLKFLFSKDLVQLFKTLQDVKDGEFDFYAELPDTTVFKINASVNGFAVDTMSVGNAMTMSVTLGVNSIDIADALPA